MQKVKNKSCIRRLSGKTLRTAKLRNLIAVIAIALTALMFTSVFTVGMSVNEAFEQQNFRQVGGSFHGGFKNVTPEQIMQLSAHPLIQSYGTRLMLGMPEEAPFLKAHVEVSYMDQNMAGFGFCTPAEGRLPREGTLEAATDTRVLKLLGVEPKVGETFTLTYDLGTGSGTSHPVTQTFTLCGWWEYDEAGMASHVLVPESYAKQVLEEYEAPEGSLAGQWDMNVFLKSARHIEEDLKRVLADNGYQSEDRTGEHYIDIGVNWGYTGAQLSGNMDPATVMGVGAAMLLIVFSGYLIIYNIFRISVTGDIRFYGLLKTIGTTGKQIKGILLRQAVILCCVGIPFGLAAGWGTGALLTPLIMENMSYQRTVLSLNPMIFVGAALFSFLTVLLSVSRPAKLAGKVSPVEAVRYTEAYAGKKKEKKREKGSGILRMAFANLGRSKSKTVLVILSMALAVVLLNITVTFVSGFDMDKYLGRFVSTDFVTAHADYFQSSFNGKENEIPQEVIETIKGQGGIARSGRTFGGGFVREYMTEADMGRMYEGWYPADKVEERIGWVRPEADENGLVPNEILLYGMEDFPLSKLQVADGDLSLLQKDPGSYIAAVVDLDDYEKPKEKSNHCQTGDKVRLQYVEESMTVDIRTGEPSREDTPVEYRKTKPVKSREKEYTVCARVAIPRSLKYRYGLLGREAFVLAGAEMTAMVKDAGIMNFVMDMQDEAAEASMEAFLKNYTENVEISMDYESKAGFVENFDGLRNMFLLSGGLLCGVVALIGILNFINAQITSVISRKQEFAMLQAVGMTGRQLKEMLAAEGCFYALGAVLAAFLVNLVTAPLLGKVLAAMFWFFTPRFGMTAILAAIPVFLLLGIAIPLISYHFMKNRSIVDRLRNVE